MTEVDHLAPGHPLHADAYAVLQGYADQPELRDAYLAFLEEHPHGMWRECLAGHVTASALVVDPDAGRVLLTLHPKVGRWLQMGGHCEPLDRSLRDAAAREAHEESGIGTLHLSPGPIRLDRHSIRCRPGIVLDHLDVQFLAVAAPGSAYTMSQESLDLAWFDWETLPPDTDESVRLLVAAARQAL